MGKKRNGYWQEYINCETEALKYKSRTEFARKSSGAYDSSIKNEWIDEVCSHMRTKVEQKRCIYVYEFENKIAYIGLTNNLSNRKNTHKHDIKSSVYEYIQKNNTKLIKIRQLTEYVESIIASNLEKQYIEEYTNNHWVLLNKNKGGGLGTSILKWTKEKCQNESLKYFTRTSFQNGSRGAYYRAYKNKWLDEICSHMIEIKKSKNYWTYEKCHEESLKYEFRNEFRKKSRSAYNYAYNNDILNDICSHMKQKYKPKNYWTKERCHEKALGYNSRLSFQKKDHSSYLKAQINGWLDEICSHMIEIKKPKNYWTKERCQNEATKYENKKDFREQSKAYERAYRNGWLDEICSHMQKKYL